MPQIFGAFITAVVAGEGGERRGSSNNVYRLGIGTLFACAAFLPGNKLMALIATGMSLGFTCLGVGLAIIYDPIMWQTPAPYAWTVIS